MTRSVLLLALLLGCDGSLVNNDDPQNNVTTSSNNGLPDGGTLVDAGVDGGGTNNMQPEPVRTDPNDLKNDDLFVCDGAPTSSPARIRRLERREFVRGVGGSETGYKASLVPATNPLNTPTTARYTTYADGVGMDATTLDLYMGVLGDSVTPWTARDARRTPRTYTDGALRCMFEDAAPDESCVAYYLTSLLEDGVLYRPPTADEMAEMTTFTNTLLAEEASTGATRAATLKRVASAAWMMTGALFRSEMGEDVEDASGRLRLTDWELAQAVAYLISDRAPGAMGIYRFGEGPNGGGWTPEDPMAGYLADIEAAARNGTIQDPLVIQSLIRANISGVDPERFDLNSDADPDRRSRRGEYWMSQKLQHFFREWLGYEGVELKFKDTPYATSQFETGSWDRGSITSSWGNLMSGYYGKEALLAQQLDDMIARIVFEDQDVFKKLMTSRQFFVASSTAYTGSSIDRNTNNVHRAYNITTEVGTAAGDRWVMLPDAERSGVMTHPAFLAAHGGNFEDDANAVHRGRWLREKVLCQTVPGLELVMVEAKLIPSDPLKTARDRVSESTDNNPQCTGCHQLMNPIGYTFETYNHAGFLRADDHGKPPNGASTLEYMPDPALNGEVSSIIELSEKLADSDYAKRCFIRQTFRYFMGRDETLADACTLDAMETSYDESGGSFMTMIETLATQDTFLYRHIAEDN